MNRSGKVVTRFAPSPTGMMHVGGIRTALYAYLWAQKHGGIFILRIEDTDKDREVVGSKEHIIEALQWLGIIYDEGPDIGGPHAPYIQSERLSIYHTYAQKLVEAGLAYPDPYTQEELESFRAQAEGEKRPFLFREHRPAEVVPWKLGMPLRFKTPVRRYEWNDSVRGKLSAGEEALDDIILIKADGYPTYNFAHIVDDIEMGVTLVCRGEEFIASTPKYLAIYEALGHTPPEFATLPPILGAGGNKKLSKRDGAKDVLEYRDEGYLPDAIVNFLALLGWHPEGDKEVFTKEALIQEFDISRVQKSGAQLDTQKLDWLNKEHIALLTETERTKNILAFLPARITQNPLLSKILPSLVPLITERIVKFSDVQTMTAAGELDFFFSPPELDQSSLSFKDILPNETKEHLEKAQRLLSGLPEWTHEHIKNILMGYADTLPKRGAVLHPVRYGLSGLLKSPDPFTIATILGKDETLSRLRKASELL